jgi:hypothetical protein
MHEAPRGQVLLVGIALLLIGSLMASNFRAFSTWHARRAIGSVRWAEPLLRRIPPWKSLLQQSLEDRVTRQVILTRIIGLVFAACGVLFLLAAFGIGGPIYTN